MRRLGVIALTWMLLWCVPAGTAWAGGKSQHEPLIARIAGRLASTIRQDAHRGGPKTVTAVRTRRSCCGAATLTVYYLATPGAYSKYGAYKLLVATKKDAMQEVVVSEFPTLTKYLFGTKTVDVPTFELDISRRMINRAERWNGRLSYDANRCRYQETPRSAPGVIAPHYCTGFGRSYLLVEREQTAVLRIALRQALNVIEQARRHAPIFTPDLEAIEPYRGP
jgi:hypothetical protein